MTNSVGGRHATGLSRVRFRTKVATMLLLVSAAVTTHTQAQSSETARLKGLSLEQLVDIEVTTLSKKSERLSRTAAAVYVLTADEIARSGCTNIPQLLRSVPGLQVAQIDGNQWAISSRGFAGAFSNKLLILIDGRSVYSPLFSGVFWDAQDVVLDDIERIEIIRGPGGSLWGANAVNGIINIIRKSAKDTVGGRVAGGIGSNEQGLGEFRLGRRVGDQSAIKLFGKYTHNGTTIDTAGEETGDDLEVVRGGVRYDLTTANQTSLEVQSDVYSGQSGATYILPSSLPPYLTRKDDRTDIAGGDILAKLSKVMSATSEVSVQGYLDFVSRDDVRLDDNQTTFDLDFSHRFAYGARSSLTWGLGYRRVHSTLRGTQYVRVDPEERTDNLWTGFAQSDFAIVPERLSLTLGTKVEHNDYTGIEYQPSVRGWWSPASDQLVWAAVSRAVRTPSRIEHDGIVNWTVIPPNTEQNPGPLPVFLRFTGSDSFDSEELISYEIGHRTTLADRVSSDLAIFYNDYSNLLSGRNGQPIFNPLTPTFVVVPITPGNGMEGKTYGFEWAVDWIPAEGMALRAAYSRLKIDLNPKTDSDTSSASEANAGSPEHQLAASLSYDDGRRFGGRVLLRYVDHLTSQNIDHYWTLDVRAGLTIRKGIELSVVGQNLLKDHQTEFITRLGTVASQINRGVLTTLSWTF